ncbi:hypothetical protein LJC15_00680 [Desulfovibrio sp. OttesenSCG-928-G11]|nr:hypothetical protein [Desulfovibrio sp. OttesenSCG-928-G11]
MDNADFLGTYILRNRHSLEVMPARNVSGMWQAWLLTGGGILVRALSEDYRPFGDTFPMSRESFFSLLMPLAPEAAAGREAAAPAASDQDMPDMPEQPDLPDLLGMWYTQAASPASEAGEAAVESAGSGAAARQGREETGAPSLLAASARERAQRMSAAFAALMAKMNEQHEADPDLDKAVEDLLAEAPPPAPEYKFIFTDFGRALRRKGRHRLSLTAHLLALACAPDDEHVLFNVARSQYEVGQSLEAVASLEKAVKAAPDFREAAHFLQFLHGSSKKNRGPL